MRTMRHSASALRSVSAAVVPATPLPTMMYCFRASADAAARLRAHCGWGAPPPRTSVAALILLSGLPGTGKSHFAAAIQARHPAAVVRSDEVRKQLFPYPTYSAGENGFVYLTCYAL